MTKRAIVEMLLSKDGEVRISFDTTQNGVVIPDQYKEYDAATLNYGYNLLPHIPDLTLTDEGISATLSFEGSPFLTFVPWIAIFIMGDFNGQRVVWEEKAPVVAKPTVPSLIKSVRARPSHLKLVN